MVKKKEVEKYFASNANIWHSAKTIKTRCRILECEAENLLNKLFLENKLIIQYSENIKLYSFNSNYKTGKSGG